MNLRPVGPKGLGFAAVVLVFLYLIFRPHFGTVYYLTAAHARMAAGGKSSIVNSTSLGHNLFVPAAPVGVNATFGSRTECDAAAESYNASNHGFGAQCAQRNALLWGW